MTTIKPGYLSKIKQICLTTTTKRLIEGKTNEKLHEKCMTQLVNRKLVSNS